MDKTTDRQESTMPLAERMEAVRFATTQIAECLDDALDRELSNEAPCVALVTRSRDLASAALDLFDDGGEHGAATKTIFAGMR